MESARIASKTLAPPARARPSDPGEPLAFLSPADTMPIARSLFITAGPVAGTVAPTPTRVTPSPAVLRVTSGVPGREVRFRGVLLVPGEPMQVIEQTTPYELRATDDLVLGAFEPEVPARCFGSSGAPTVPCLRWSPHLG
jgi:hypothetical protein